MADTIRVNQESLDQEKGLAWRKPNESGKRESKIEEGKPQSRDNRDVVEGRFWWDQRIFDVWL
jgi:hypothetical protein